MKRSNLWSAAMIMFAVALMFSLSACEKDLSTMPTGTTTADYLLAGPELITGEVVEGSLTQEFALNAPADRMLFEGNKPPKPPMKRPPLQLGKLMRMLELDSIQRVDVEGFMAIFRDCVEENRLALRAAQLPIIQAANAQRQAILADLQAGLITREQAIAALRQVHINTKLAMDTDEDVLEAREALKDCHDTLLESIEDILTADQLVKWNRFFANIRG